MAGNAIFIYGLHCPETGELRYIGKAKDPYERLKGHIRDTRYKRNERRPVADWIRSLALRGLSPVVNPIEITGPDQWQERETAIIAMHRERGTRLLNIADGGDQPKATKESCQKAAATANRKRGEMTPRRKRLYQLTQRLAVMLFNEQRNGPSPLLDKITGHCRMIGQRFPEKFPQWVGL